jgi:uncharacterized protein (TIGR04255 family)
MAASLAEHYPNVSETELAKIIGMLEIPPAAGQLATHVFKTSNEQRIVQLGPRGVTITVKDYVDSFDFESAIKPVLTSYFEHADVKQVFRLGLRYVNDIREKEPLTASFHWPALTGGTSVSTSSRAVFGYTEPEGMLGVAVAPLEGTGVRLDLDFWLEPRSSVTLGDVFNWFDGAHERIHEAFVAMVKTDVYAGWAEGVRVHE